MKWKYKQYHEVASMLLGDKYIKLIITVTSCYFKAHKRTGERRLTRAGVEQILTLTLSTDWRSSSYWEYG